MQIKPCRSKRINTLSNPDRYHYSPPSFLPTTLQSTDVAIRGCRVAPGVSNVTKVTGDRQTPAFGQFRIFVSKPDSFDSTIFGLNISYVS